MISGITSLPAVGKARGYRGHTESSWLGGFQAQKQTFPPYVYLHKRFGESKQWKWSVFLSLLLNVIFRAETLHMRLAQYVRDVEEVWRRVDNLFCLGEKRYSFTLKISCKRKNKPKLFGGYYYMLLLYWRVCMLLLLNCS